MNTATIELPTGAELQREIEDIEARKDGERIRQTIADRVAIANSSVAAFVRHDEVFATSRARLMAKLTGKADA
jgi:hypothetical protein